MCKTSRVDKKLTFSLYLRIKSPALKVCIEITVSKERCPEYCILSNEVFTFCGSDFLFIIIMNLKLSPPQVQCVVTPAGAVSVLSSFARLTGWTPVQFSECHNF